MSPADESLAAAFVDAFGARPDGVWSAPGRVNLIGEHTDYSDGYVLPLAVAARARAAVGVRRDRHVRLRSLQQPGADADLDIDLLTAGAETSPAWAVYPAGAVWALRESGIDVPGLDVVVDSAVPIGAGLSSSAAVICATALAASTLAGTDVDPLQLALLGQRAENVIAGVPCGVMDHVAAMLARAGHALFLDVRALQVEQVPLPLDDHRLLVIDTGVRHALSDGSYADRRRCTEQVAQQLGVNALRDIGVGDLDEALGRLVDPEQQRRLRHVVTENQRVLDTVACLRAGRLADVGRLLSQSHTSLRDDFEVSVPALDDAVAAALDGGALGARMTGGGFGGSVIALVPADGLGALEAAVQHAAETAGHPQPVFYVERPADGAHRDVSAG